MHREVLAPQVQTERAVAEAAVERVVLPLAFLTVEQVAQVFNRSRSLVEQWIAWGYLIPVEPRIRGQKRHFAWPHVAEVIERFAKKGYPTGPMPS